MQNLEKKITLLILEKLKDVMELNYNNILGWTVIVNI